MLFIIHICIQLVIVNRGWREREWILMAAVYARGHTQSKAGFRIFCCDQMCMLYVNRNLLLLSLLLLKLHIIYSRPFPNLHGQ